MTDPTRTFRHVLAGAIADSPLSLDQIRARLVELGTPVSTATLSYWSTGRSVPRRAGSRRAVEHLEQILDLAPGTLVTALSPTEQAAWHPLVGMDAGAAQEGFSRMGLDLLRTVAVHVLADAVRISGDLDWLTVQSTRLHVAEQDGVRRLTQAILAPSPGARLTSLTAGHGARVDVWEVLPDGSALFALDFVRPLARGDAGQVSLQARWESTTPITGYRLRIPMQVAHLAMALEWVGGRPHPVCYRHEPPTGQALEEVELGSSELVQFCPSPAGPGVHTLSWA